MFVVASLYFAATVAAIFVATIYLDMCITSAVKQIKEGTDPEEVHCKMCRREEDDPIHDVKSVAPKHDGSEHYYAENFGMKVGTCDREQLNKLESLLDKFTENNVRLRQQLNERDDQILIKLKAFAKWGFLGDVNDPFYVESVRLENVGFEAAHELCACGHSRGDYRDPQYGTDAYAGNEKCVGCETNFQARAEGRKTGLKEAAIIAEQEMHQWDSMEADMTSSVVSAIRALADSETEKK